MRTTLIAILVIGGVALGWAAASAQQEVRPTPGPGSGMTTVRGVVDIGNVPNVMARQSGEWHVTVANPSPIPVPGADFLTPRGRYTIAWPAGERETVTILDLGQAGWAQVEHAAGKGTRRWVNLGVALSIEEAR
jgi:hypothetical protein